MCVPLSTFKHVSNWACFLLISDHRGFFKKCLWKLKFLVLVHKITRFVCNFSHSLPSGTRVLMFLSQCQQEDISLMIHTQLLSILINYDAVYFYYIFIYVLNKVKCKCLSAILKKVQNMWMCYVKLSTEFEILFCIYLDKH